MATDVAVLAMKFQTSGASSVMQTLKGLQDGSLKAQKATSTLTNSVKISGKQFKLNNQFVQQAGFQVGDFATQVASGQSALVAFTQQFTQLAGFLGPSGPVLGAIVAIGGAIAVGLSNAFSEAEDDASDLIDRINNIADSVDNLTDAQVKALKADFFAKNQERLQGIIKERERISELNREIERREELLSRPAGQRINATGSGILGTDISGLQRQVQGTKELQAEINGLRSELDKSQASVDTYFQESKKLGDEIDNLISGSKEERDAISDLRKEIDRLNDSLAFQVDTYGQSERAIKLAEIAQLEKNGADSEAVSNAISLTNALYDQIEAQKRRNDLENKRTSIISQLDPAQAERKRFQERLDLIDEFDLSVAERDSLRIEAMLQHNAAIDRIREEDNKGFAQYTQARQNLDSQILSSATSTASNLAGVVRQSAGEQSDAYRVAFLAQQAFALASTIVNTQLAAAAALAPPPIGLGPVAGAPYAGVIQGLGAANAAIIGAQTVAGFAGSFEGGGFTGTGSRTGGIDGRGGFPAILHPNETVIDHTQGQGMGGNVNVIINNAPPGTTVRESTDENGTRFINVFLADMANGGPMSRSMQSTFGVRRQGR